MYLFNLRITNHILIKILKIFPALYIVCMFPGMYIVCVFTGLYVARMVIHYLYIVYVFWPVYCMYVSWPRKLCGLYRITAECKHMYFIDVFRLVKL